MSGAFQTSRDIFGSPIWKNVVDFRMFFLIYGNAVFSEDGVRLAEDLVLKRGEWCRSTRKLQEDLEYIENRQLKRYSTSVVNRCIKRLVDMQMICTRTHQLGTVFTVVNYEKYQGLQNYKNDNLERNLEHSGNSGGTLGEHSGNNNNNVNNAIKVNNDSINHIYEFWNQQSIIVHRELTKKTSSKINARLDKYSAEELTEAIRNYNTIISSELYWYTHKFTLEKFMEPKNVEQFMSANNPFENFRKSKGGNGGGYRPSNHQHVPADPESNLNRFVLNR